MNSKLLVPIACLGGFTVAVMLGQTSGSRSTIEQRVTDLERRVAALEAAGRTTKPDRIPASPAGGSLSTTDIAKYVGSAEAQVFADDGEFLGDLTGAVGSKSIGNEVGSFGSEVASKSMWNEVGRYGGKVASLSPFNEVSSRPPKLIYKGEFVCYVTVNNVKTPRVHPLVLRLAVRGE